VTIALVENVDSVQLTIEDDGVGFNPQKQFDINGSQGWGQCIMRERAEAANGRFYIESQPRQGTKVITEIRR